MVLHTVTNKHACKQHVRPALSRRRSMPLILSILAMIAAYGGGNGSGGVLGFAVPNGARMNPAIPSRTAGGTSGATSTQLFDKKWGPRWNPTPDSDFYRGSSDNRNIYGGRISSIGVGRRGRRRKFRSKYRNGGIVTVQRLLVVSAYPVVV